MCSSVHSLPIPEGNHLNSITNIGMVMVNEKMKNIALQGWEIITLESKYPRSVRRSTRKELQQKKKRSIVRSSSNKIL